MTADKRPSLTHMYKFSSRTLEDNIYINHIFNKILESNWFLARSCFSQQIGARVAYGIKSQ